MARKKRLRLLSEVALRAVKRRLARHGVARKGVDGRLRSPFFRAKKWRLEFLSSPTILNSVLSLKLKNFAVK